LDMIHEYGVSVGRIKMLAAGGAAENNERALLSSVAEKAEQYYGSADRLLPLIDADSRAALWVLVTIYHELLLKVSNAGGGVFRERISVSTPAKLAILAKGAAMALHNRMTA